MTEPLIQTTDLSRTFQALRNRDPLKLERQTVPTHPDYRRVPSSNYSPITSVNTGSWGNGMARFASSSGIVYGQPQFFSPVHTPINWQIPSKRLEEYQWMYLPNTQVLREDFTYESIENNIFNCNNIIDDDVTGGFIFETDNYPKILNSEGKFNRPPRIGMRECENKKCFSIATIGNYGIIKVSEEHNLFVLDGNVHRRNKKVLGNKKYRESKGIKPNGVEKVKIQDRLIKKIKAQDVSKLDYLLTPVPKIGEVSIDKDLAWLIGFCVADGCIYEKDGSYSVRFTGYKDEKALLHCKEILEKKFDGKITSKPHGDGKGWRINASTKKAYSFFRKYILNKGIEKKFSKEIFDLDRESRLYILAGYFDGDGCYEKGQRKLISSCYSKDLADQTYWLLISCQISASIGKCAISKNHYPTSSECFYRVIIPSPEVSNISKYMNSNKVPLDFISKKERLLKFFYTEDGITYLTNPINGIKEFLYTGKGFDIEMTNERRALVADGYIGSNCRFFYQNEPKIGAAIDFYSEFPMSNWEHECRNRTVKLYFDRLKEKLKLQKWCRLISHEVHLLGDCFPFIEVDCPLCFSEGTMILTKNGHKEIENISVGDIVLTKEREWKEVEQTMSFKYNGEMIEIDATSLPRIKSTKDHKHYIVRPEYRDDNRVKNADWDDILEVEASEIKEGDYLVSPISDFMPTTTESIYFDGSIYRKKNKDLGKKIKIDLDEDFARLIGWFVAEGSTDSNRTIHFTLNIKDEMEYLKNIQTWMKKYFELDTNIEEHWAHSVGQVIGYSREVSAWFDINCGHGSDCKKVPEFILSSPINIKKAFLEAYILGDGHRRKSKDQITMSTVSRKLCYDIVAMLLDLGIACYVDEKDEQIDSLGIHRKKTYTMNFREEVKRENGKGTHREEKYIYFKVRKITRSIEKTVVYNFSVEDNHNYCANMFFTKNCNGSGRIGSDICEHDGGTVRRVIILNPDYVEVLSSPLNPDPIIALRPDEELINMVQRKTPGYEKLSTEVRKLIAAGQPIKLDNTSVSHLKYGENGYAKYGIGMVRRLFPILSYKTKLMVAQWIVAERLIVPIKIVKVGSDERPAGPADIAAVQAQLAQTANDPNLTIVTHHAFEMDFVGASGKVLTLSNEFELINQEILDGMMINNALLNGEGPTFSAAAVGIEAMIQRLKTFREQVTDWLREAIYIPEARRQAAAGNEAFITKNDDTGEEEVIVPKIKWDNMHLRDQQQFRTFVMQLYEKGLLSAQTVLETFDFDPDQEIERKRYDALQMVALGQGLQGGMGGAGGGGDMGGGMGGLPSPGGGGEPPIGAPDMGGPGTPSEGPSAPTGGGPAIAKSSSITATQVDPSQFGGRVLKKRTRERILSEQQKQQRMYEVQQNQEKRVMDAASGGNGGTERDEKGRIINTKAERDLIPHLKKAHQDGLFGNYAIVKQFRVQAQDQEYPLDFAIPSLKIGIEADGEIFHSAPKQKAHDKERDMKLSQQGWTIVRFTDEEIEKNPQMVVQSIIKTFMQKQLYVKNMAKGQEGQPQ